MSGSDAAAGPAPMAASISPDRSISTRLSLGDDTTLGGATNSATCSSPDSVQVMASRFTPYSDARMPRVHTPGVRV